MSKSKLLFTLNTMEEKTIYNKYLQGLVATFNANANANIAIKQAKYMRNQFEFLGIPAPVRKALQKSYLHKKALPPKDELFEILKFLWELPAREYQYFAQELLLKYHKQFTSTDIGLIEYISTHKSWWDTIDFIAANIFAVWCKEFPIKKMTIIDAWLASNNIWLQRNCLLFQLKYKEQTDTELLAHIITYLLGSNEFFIDKAIGWILRSYSRTDAEWVLSFVEKHDEQLAKLSKREGLKLIR